MNILDEKIFDKINGALLDLKNKPQEQSNVLILIDEVVEMNGILRKLFEKLEELNGQVNGGTKSLPLKELSAIFWILKGILNIH